MSDNQKPLHVVELRSENVKRLRAVRIRPSGATVIIGGNNAAGKSSVLDSIEMALNGGRSIPSDPIRHGAKRAVTTVDLGELVIERTYTSAGSQLVVRNKDGVKQTSPQGILDALLGTSRSVAFDPLEFARMKPAEQDKLLKQLAGLDFDAVDRKREALYAERAGANRDLKGAEARLTSMPSHDGAQPVDVSALHAELKTRTEARVAREKAIAAADSAHGSMRAAQISVESVEKSIADLEKRLAARRVDLAAEIRNRDIRAGEHEALKAAVPPEVNADDLHEKIATAETRNRKVRENAERAKCAATVRSLRENADALTHAIQRADDDKAAMIAGAKFSVAGLGFGEHGPTLNGVPLEQASSAEKLRLSVAIGAALNPRVKVMLVRDGSLLDDDSMRLLAELAETSGSQVWVERVGSKDPSAVVIEDGEVVDGPL